MGRFFHTAAAAALLAALLLMLTGCWSDDLQNEHADDLSGLAGAEGLTEEQQEPEAPAITSFALPILPGETLDPFTCGDGIQQLLMPLLYEGLYEPDEHFAPQERLCAEGSASADFKTWTFTLRSDAVFSDGTPVTASDVEASLQRARTTARYSARLTAVESITTAGSGQLVIRLTEGNNRFPALLDIPILSRASIGKPVPIGSGPYFYEKQDSREHLVPNTHRPDSASLPLKEIRLQPLSDSTTLSHLFSSHEIQMVATDYIGSAPVSYKGSATVAEIPTTILQYLGFNCREGRLFADPALRRAVSLGIHRDSIVKAYFSGHAVSAAYPVSPLSAWQPEGGTPGYSAEAFRSAMEKAGYTSGRKHTVSFLVCDGNPFRISAARAIAAALSVYDLNVQLNIQPYDAYLEALRGGHFDLYYGEVRMTPDFNCGPLLKTGGSLNYGGFSDPLIDAQITSAFTTAATPVGTNSELMAAIQSAAPIVPISFKSLSVVLQGGVVDEITPTCANPFYQFSEWKINMKGENNNG